MNPGMTVALDKSMMSAPGGDTNPFSTLKTLSSRPRIDTCCPGLGATGADDDERQQQRQSRDAGIQHRNLVVNFDLPTDKLF
jgi:hypothetical protein